MKSAATLAGVAALANVAAAAQAGSFGTLGFTSKYIARARIDPIVNPGGLSNHMHGAVGASNFAADSTGESLAKSKCTSSNVKEDLSSYWFPWVYFQDPKTKEFEAVEVNYVKVYYFFEATDDDMKAFPQGLQIFAGNASTRVTPGTGNLQLDPSKGPIQPVQFTCPRANNAFDSPPSWPTDSDGSSAGIRDTINKGSGTGFPDVDCDGRYSPMRTDIHLPSCYNPEAGLTDYKNNMAYPSSAGGGKKNCPEGWIHVPHMFYEVYWSTMDFAGRWTPNNGEQPFVLSSGDVTGYGYHADFISAWDEKALQSIIDGCNPEHAGLHTCPGVTQNTEECEWENESPIDEDAQGPMKSLPGDCKLEGYAHGIAAAIGDAVEEILPKPTKSKPTPTKAEEEAAPKPTADKAAEKPEAPVAPVAPIFKEEPAAAAPSPQATDAPVAAAEQPSPQEAAQGNPRVKTVWETVTVTSTEVSAPTPDAAKMRRHVHNHALRHRRSRR